MVFMDSLKFHPGPPCLTLLCPAGVPPRNGLTTIYGVTRLQGGRPAAVFYPLGQTTQYGPLQSLICAWAYGKKHPWTP
jgi:hypothetical protein